MRMTTGEVRLDDSRPARSSGSARSTGLFDRLLRTPQCDLPLSKMLETTILASEPPGNWGTSE
jgi:hypothetical protein